MFYFLCSVLPNLNARFSVFTVNEAAVEQQCQPLVAPRVQDVETVKKNFKKTSWQRKYKNAKSSTVAQQHAVTQRAGDSGFASAVLQQDREEIWSACLDV